LENGTPTRVIRWNVECGLGHRSITYVVGGDSYGRLLGSTPHNEMALFDSWKDPVFDEVEGVVKELLGRDRGFSDCFQIVLGVSCDPAPSGDLYDFSGKVYCPVCGSLAVTYGPDNPPRVELIALPVATHRAWEQLGTPQKRDLVRQALDRSGCRLRCGPVS
jgi:hypothetical protein